MRPLIWMAAGLLAAYTAAAFLFFARAEPTPADAMLVDDPTPGPAATLRYRPTPTSLPKPLPRPTCAQYARQAHDLMAKAEHLLAGGFTGPASYYAAAAQTAWDHCHPTTAEPIP